MEEKHQSILTAATQLFKEQGYKDTNISQITQAANMAVELFIAISTQKKQSF